MSMSMTIKREKHMTDLEKAIRKLEDRHAETLLLADKQSTEYQNLLASETLSRATGIGEAVEILKTQKFRHDYAFPRGPCTWERSDNGGMTHYETACRNNGDFGDTVKAMAFVFCPWCGRPVRELEG